MAVLIYLNGLRNLYAARVDEAARILLRSHIEVFSLASSTFFGVFIFAFALGGLFYGISLFGGDRFDGVLSGMFLLWSVGSFVAFGNYFWKIDVLSKALEPWNTGYQPLVRLVLGVWLWRMSRGGKEQHSDDHFAA
jgi:hypothetical protein